MKEDANRTVVMLYKTGFPGCGNTAYDNTNKVKWLQERAYQVTEKVSAPIDDWMQSTHKLQKFSFGYSFLHQKDRIASGHEGQATHNKDCHYQLHSNQTGRSKHKALVVIWNGICKKCKTQGRNDIYSTFTQMLWHGYSWCRPLGD